MKYGYSIHWTQFDGTKQRVSAEWFDTLEEMERERAEAFKTLKKVGWTPPRWWQWWRWNDTRLSV